MFQRPLQLLILAMLIAGPPALGQTPAWTAERWQDPLSSADWEAKRLAELESKRIQWPQPVRLAAHEQAMSEVTTIPGETSHLVFGASAGHPPQSLPPQNLHRVIRSPHSAKKSTGGFAGGSLPSGSLPGGSLHSGPLQGGILPSGIHGDRTSPKPPLYHTASKLKGAIQPPVPILPAGKQQETWKTPYSYGYFGASSSRRWSRHPGYRDRHTEWRLW